MKKILVSGGPVHAYLDPVKIITNKFKGGLMVQLAEDLGLVHNITMLCTKATLPSGTDWIGRVVHHDGFEDYRKKVMELAPEMDAVILGAAVANLIPLHPYKDKFPSHNYKVGDVIPIEFTIAPRVIDEVKAVMKPGAHLFGFKLLAGQSHEELIRAAYETLLNSHATAVVANDPMKGLENKFVVTKERGVHSVRMGSLHRFIGDMIEDRYYSTSAIKWTSEYFPGAWVTAKHLCEKYEPLFVEVGDMKFGTVAWRFTNQNGGFGFVTTARGKQESGDLIAVLDVNHKSRTVIVLTEHTKLMKATLNAPLLARIFEARPDVHGILHFHREEKGLMVQPYAPPGTVRDTDRDVRVPFNIENHGSFMFLNNKGEVIQ